MNVTDVCKTIEMFTSGIVDPIIEIRMLKTRKGTVSGYYNKEGFKNIDRDIKKYNGMNNIYVVMNEPKKELIARGVNKLREFTQETTKDDDIVRRHWLLLDFDPIRVAGICSTDEEKEKAYQLSNDCRMFLNSIGFPNPVVTDSGNGYHNLYKVDIENTKENIKLVKSFITALAEKFDNDDVKIDRI